MLLAQLGLLEWLKFVQASQEFLFRLVCVIKCLMILMESYYYHLLYISFGYVFCLHMLCIKVYRKTSVGETHRNNKTEFNRENYEVQKVMDQGPCAIKRASSSSCSRPPSLLFGPAGPSWCHLAPSFVLGQVCANMFYFHMFHFPF